MSFYDLEIARTSMCSIARKRDGELEGKRKKVCEKEKDTEVD